jgi:hypothetical protein
MERRSAPRATVRLPVSYRAPDGVEYGATLADISQSGLRLVGGETIPVGIRLQIRFIDESGQRHELSGDVVRSQPGGGFAVSLVTVAPETVDFINQVVKPQSKERSS